jgi:hypothetical protein
MRMGKSSGQKLVSLRHSSAQSLCQSHCSGSPPMALIAGLHGQVIRRCHGLHSSSPVFHLDAHRFSCSSVSSTTLRIVTFNMPLPLWQQIHFCVPFSVRPFLSGHHSTPRSSALIISMYRALGTQWATSVLAFVAVLMIPIPFAFYKYGPQIRERSKWAQSL